MTNRFLSLAFAALIALGCGSSATQEAEPVATVLTDYEVFGEDFDQANAIPVAMVAADAEAHLGNEITVSGKITQVCQGSGCWMTLQVPNSTKPMRVVMPRNENNEYLFTLDRDISGREAVVRGTLGESTMAEFEAPMHGNGGEDHHEGEGDDHEMSDSKEWHITAAGVLVASPEETESATD